MIQSFAEKDENGMVDYIVNSRFMGEMLKRFFAPSSIKKKAKLLSMPIVKFNELMDGWTEESIRIEINSVKNNEKEYLIIIILFRYFINLMKIKIISLIKMNIKNV